MQKRGRTPARSNVASKQQSASRVISGEHSFHADVWLYPGVAAWHFVTLPKTLSANLKENYGMTKRGWGSLPVRVRIGSTIWDTSIFPDSKAGAYLLPLKADVRKHEGIRAGKAIEVMLVVRG